MKKVTASEARRRWFRLLDEAVQGEVVVVERGGHRLVLRREHSAKARKGARNPKYRSLLRVPRANEADRWSWAWPGPEGGLRATKRSTR
jgi:antitoxin (DNA-binding transcriptional repressor) of toxin-antitoxin stability system